MFVPREEGKKYNTVVLSRGGIVLAKKISRRADISRSRSFLSTIQERPLCMWYPSLSLHFPHANKIVCSFTRHLGGNSIAIHFRLKISPVKSLFKFTFLVCWFYSSAVQKCEIYGSFHDTLGPPFPRKLPQPSCPQIEYSVFITQLLFPHIRRLLLNGLSASVGLAIRVHHTLHI